jgi:hypothetical protein
VKCPSTTFGRSLFLVEVEWLGVGVGEKERKSGDTGLGFEISLDLDGSGFGVAICCDDDARGSELGGSWDVVGGGVLTGEPGWDDVINRASERAGSGGTLTVLGGS